MTLGRAVNVPFSACFSLLIDLIRIHQRKEIDFQKAAHLTLRLQPSAKMLDFSEAILQPVVSEGKYVRVRDWFKVHSVYVGHVSAATVRFTPWTQGNSEKAAAAQTSKLPDRKGTRRQQLSP